MGAWGSPFGALWLAAMLAASASAQESVSATEPAPASVLLAPVQGTTALRMRSGARLAAAVRRGLEAQGYHASTSQERVGRALVACQTPECIAQALDLARAAFAVVPAIWLRKSGGEEVTLTLVQRSGRSLNARAAVGNDLAVVAVRMVEALLARRGVPAAAAGAGSAAAMGSASATETATGSVAVDRQRGRGHPHAWKSGPIVLIAGGAAAIAAIGVAAAVKGDDQQLRTSAVAAWAAVGAAAIGAGVAWWLVADKRRQSKRGSPGALALELAVFPSKIDFRLRF